MLGYAVAHTCPRSFVRRFVSSLSLFRSIAVGRGLKVQIVFLYMQLRTLLWYFPLDRLILADAHAD
jgi:hypothetical protein